jgi:hypothetical protein
MTSGFLGRVTSALVGIVLCGLPQTGWADTRRFALIAGANDGGDDRVQLRYAVTDANAFGSVLEDLGGVSRANQTLLIEPDAGVLRGAIENLAQTVAIAEDRGMRTEVIFYYSGHSDENGLLLGDTLYEYPALKADLEAIGADVRVAILDSCASGALVRTKGGVQRPAFLEDRSNDVEGTAYLMSSSANESAQESDAVGASFFTHYLVSGLRGGADLSQDGRVTLDEAYRYATAETLRRTERTSLGPQHATYSYKLGGHGDFVFTDLSATDSSLILDAGASGRYFIRNVDGQLVAEVEKVDGRPVEIALGSGQYSVVLDKNGQQYDAVFHIGDSEHLMIGDLEFLEFQGELATARGTRSGTGEGTDLSTPAPTAGAAGGTIVTAEPGGSDRPAPPDVPAVPAAPQEAPPGRATARAPEPVDTALPPVIAGGSESSPPERTVDYGDHTFQGGVFVARAETVRIQMGTIGTIASAVTGVQLAGVFNSAAKAQAIQATFGLNRAETLEGIQVAMGVNIATAASQGWQSALFVNIAADSFIGAQTSFVNVAGEMKGVQVGFVNRSSAAKGLQIGLVNSGGDGSGLQLGIVNIADEYDGAAVGLVTVHRKGYNHVFVNSGTMEPFVVSASWGSQYIYTNVQVGTGFKNGPSVAAGVGAHLPIRKFYIDTDLAGGYRFSGVDEGVVVRARMQPGLELGKRFAIQTGIVVEAQSLLGIAGVDPGTDPDRLAQVGRTVGWTVGVRF